MHRPDICVIVEVKHNYLDRIRILLGCKTTIKSVVSFSVDDDAIFPNTDINIEHVFRPFNSHYYWTKIQRD